MKKRIQNRSLLTRPIKIISKKNRKHLGNIVDINTGGMCIVSKYQLPHDQTLQLLIDLTDEDLPFNEIELEAKNVWIKEEMVNRYFAGLKFEDSTEEARQILLKQLIKHLGFPA